MPTPRVQSVDRAFALLNCLVDSGGMGSLPAMAARCGLSIATTHRLLATLENLGAVFHMAPGKYRIGTALFRLTNGASCDELLAAAATNNLQRICKTLSTTAHLGVLNEDYMVTYVAKASRTNHAPPTVVGGQLEAYCSGLGKVLLAALPEERQARYVTDGPFIPLTPGTITEPAALIDEMRLVARRGYAVDECELFDDLRCVAVPVKDRSGAVIAALSASAPPAQLPRTKIAEIATVLAQHAQEIGTRLYPNVGSRKTLNA